MGDTLIVEKEKTKKILKQVSSIENGS